MTFQKNSQGKQQEMDITGEERRLLYAWTMADKMLYDHFRRKLDRKIRAKSRYITEEVKKLQEMRQAFFKNCIQKTVKDTRGDGDNTVNTYKIAEGKEDTYLCKYRAATEGKLNKYLRSSVVAREKTANL